MQVRVARSGGQLESRRSRIAIWGGCVTHDAPTLIQRLGRFNVPYFDFKVQSCRHALRAARGNRTVDDDARLALTRSLSQRASFDKAQGEWSRQKPFVL